MYGLRRCGGYKAHEGGREVEWRGEGLGRTEQTAATVLDLSVVCDQSSTTVSYVGGMNETSIC